MVDVIKKMKIYKVDELDFKSLGECSDYAIDSFKELTKVIVKLTPILIKIEMLLRNNMVIK